MELTNHNFTTKINDSFDHSLELHKYVHAMYEIKDEFHNNRSKPPR
jgi:hypothetical protein